MEENKMETAQQQQELGKRDFRRDAAEGLLIRGGIPLENPSREAMWFSQMTLHDLAIECLEHDGMSGARCLSSDYIFEELSRTVTFPAILDKVVEEAFAVGHRTAPVTFDQWTKKGTLKDFRPYGGNYPAGAAGEYVEVTEGSELGYNAPMVAKGPVRQLKTYGKQFIFSRQAFINDDIGCITQLPARYARAERKTINTQCYQILMDNPVIYDGKPLFDKDHYNLFVKGTGITEKAIRIMVDRLASYKDESGQFIDIRPSVLIVPVGCAFEACNSLNSLAIHGAANPFYQRCSQVKVVEDPTINQLAGGFGNAMPWWLVGAAEDTDFIEVDYLNGRETPRIRRTETMDQLGFVWNIYLDWGISVMDYRGAIKNPGIVVNSPIEMA